MKILVTLPDGIIRDTFFTDKQKSELAALGEVVYNPYARHMTGEELRDALSGVDYVFSGWGTHMFTEEVLEKADKLKLICHVGGTVKPYVSKEAYDRGIKVVSGNDLYADSVAEGVIAYILCVLRRLPHYSGDLKKGIWPTEVQNRGMIGRSIGLVGLGAISRRLIPYLHLLQMDVSVFSRYITPEDENKLGIRSASVEEIFKSCDIVSLHSAYTEATHHMISGDLIRTMKKDSLLVNTARGQLIDEKAMVEALAERPDIIAVLDVYENDQIGRGDPLTKLDNTFLMPHMGGPTIDMRAVVTSALCREIVRCESSEPLKYEVSWETCKRQTLS